MKKIIEIIKKKWLKDTFLTILLVAILFAIYFGINYGAEKLNIKDIDTTTNKVYSISEATKTKLGDLNKDVEIQLINLSSYTFLQDFASQYTKINSHIKAENINNLASRSDLMAEYNLESTDKLIVIKSGDRETTLTLSDLYTYDYSTYEQIDVTEEKLTNAIINVTIENKPKIYFLTGHNSYSDASFSAIRSKIEDESNEVYTLNLLIQGSIPEDCNCLIITAIESDLTEMERDAIINYSNNGGKILLLADSEYGQETKPNFQEILNLYGFSISKVILLEQDKDRMVYAMPQYIIAPITSTINGKTNMNLNMCAIFSGRIEFKDDNTLSNIGVTYTTIAQTSDSAFLRTNFQTTSTSKMDQDEDAPNSIIGALVTRTLGGGKTAQMIVYSNAIFATNQQISIDGIHYVYANDLCNNIDVAINSVSYLTEREDTITIRKDEDSVTYTVTQSQHNLIMAIIFLVPLAIIIVGIVVWQIRRRKR